MHHARFGQIGSDSASLDLGNSCIYFPFIMPPYTEPLLAGTGSRHPTDSAFVRLERSSGIQAVGSCERKWLETGGTNTLLLPLACSRVIGMFRYQLPVLLWHEPDRFRRRYR